MVVLDIRTVGTEVVGSFKVQGCDPESGAFSDPVFEVGPGSGYQTMVGS